MLKLIGYYLKQEFILLYSNILVRRIIRNNNIKLYIHNFLIDGDDIFMIFWFAELTSDKYFSPKISCRFVEIYSLFYKKNEKFMANDKLQNVCRGEFYVYSKTRIFHFSNPKFCCKDRVEGKNRMELSILIREFVNLRGEKIQAKSFACWICFMMGVIR